MLTYALASPFEKIAQTELARKFNVSADDIQNFRRRNKEEIDNLRHKLLLREWDNIEDHFKALAFLAIDRAGEAMPKASAKDAALIAGISVEKSILIADIRTRHHSAAVT